MNRKTGNPIRFYALALLVLSLFSGALKAQSRDEIINGSYFIVFGRYASTGELSYWRQNVGSRNIAQMIENHKGYLASNQVEREETVKRSYMDAFGWNPSSDELRYWSGQNKTYAELLQNHVNNWLNVYPDRKELVIKQSYYKVFNRPATGEEVRYWKSQPTYSFVQLVATHTTWKQRHQRNSTVTPINPGIRENGISTAGLSPQAISAVVAAGGMNVVAPGGGNVVAAGGMNAVAAGGAN
jgi:hypothetical protein